MLFDQRFWAYVVERRHLRFDSRFIPRAERPSQACLIYFLIEGTFAIDGRSAFVGPSLFGMEEDDFEGAGSRAPQRFVAEGELFVALDLRFARQDIKVDFSRGPEKLEVAERAWTAARAVVASRDQGGAADAMRTLIGALEHENILRPGLAARVDEGDARFSRFWKGVSHFISSYQALPSLKELADRSELSIRQVAREAQAFLDAFGVLGSRWREVTLRSRLKLAVLGLSAADVTVADVARASGYGSTDAMARAFRDAGLPAPSAVQAALRAPA
jgi:AraC-like DNA-binding protein